MHGGSMHVHQHGCQSEKQSIDPGGHSGIFPLQLKKKKLSDNFSTVGLGLNEVVRCLGHLLSNKFSIAPCISIYPTLPVLASL